MSPPNLTLDRTRLRETLVTVLDHAMPACAEVEYCLVGTGAALLHGVDLPVGDIDITVKRREDVDAFGAALSSFRCLFPPTWLPDARQYYANYEVHGVEVGISTVEIESDSDAIETFGHGPWEHFSLLPCGPYAIPTVALELRLATELFRQRTDRYIPLIGYLKEHGCDIGLLRRAMQAGRLPQDLQADVLNQVEGRSTR